MMKASCVFAEAIDNVGVGRHFVIDRLTEWGCTDSYTAALLVTELLTNAIIHVGGMVAVEVEMDSGGITIGVHDDNAELPVTTRRDDLAEHGRGMTLVDALATTWGSREWPDNTKTVWFKLDA
ncbi:MAG: hypothetical protein NVSMB4_17260 [Acidimicrobiales bacterium]